MRALRRLAVLPAALLLGLTLHTPAAMASTSVHTDARGDALARFDLRQVAVTNGADHFRVRATVADLPRRGPMVFGVTILPRTGSRFSYHVNTVLRRDGSSTTRVGQSGETIPCRTTQRWRHRADVVSFRFPQRCLVRHRTVRVSAFTANPHHGDPSDITRTFRVPR